MCAELVIDRPMFTYYGAKKIAEHALNGGSIADDFYNRSGLAVNGNKVVNFFYYVGKISGYYVFEQAILRDYAFDRFAVVYYNEERPWEGKVVFEAYVGSVSIPSSTVLRVKLGLPPIPV